MNRFLVLLLSLVPLASCNVVVTSPDEPGLSADVDALVGRWRPSVGEHPESEGDYLLVGKTDVAHRYRADIYEDGIKDDSPLFSLCQDRGQGKYWGFAVSDESLQGELLFHLVLSEDRAEFRWLNGDKTAALLDRAGLPYDKEASSDFIKWTRVRIRASRTELLDVLKAGGNRILDSDLTIFRRVRPQGAPDSGA